MLTDLELTGRTRSHVVQYAAPRFAAQPQAAEAFLSMRAAAQKDGIDMQPFSTFRDFNTQLRIWNHKFAGKKPLYDEYGRVRDRSAMSEEELSGIFWIGRHYRAAAGTIGARKSTWWMPPPCRRATVRSCYPKKRAKAAFSVRCTNGWMKTCTASVSSARIKNSRAACFPNLGI